MVPKPGTHAGSADGRNTGRAQARASRPRGRRRKRERRRRDIAGGWLACGPHNAGRMQTCEQTGRWERTEQVIWTTAPRTNTDTVKVV
jgi:hypothetical protein